MGMSQLWTDEGNNRTRVRLYVNVYADCWYYVGYGTDAYIHIDVSHGNIEGTTNWTPWSIARPTQTSLNGNYTTTTVWYGDYWFNHDANGYGRYRIYGSFESWGTYGTPTLWSDTGYVTTSLPDYNRSPNNPGGLTLSRDTNGTRIRLQSSTTIRNSGPTCDYWRIYRSIDGGASWPTYWDAPSGNTLDVYWTGLSSTQTYHFHAYPHNSDGFSSGHTGVYGIYGAPSPPGKPTISTNTLNSGTLDLDWPDASSNLTVTQYDIYNGSTYIKSTTGNPAPSATSISGLTPGSLYNYNVWAYNSSGWSASASTASDSWTAGGSPAAPTIGTPSAVGLRVTVPISASPNQYNVPINTSDTQQGYFLEYCYSDTSGGTYSAWSSPIRVSNQTGISHVFDQIPYAGKWYKFRAYAANTIINNTSGVRTYYPHQNASYTANRSAESTPFFVSAGGRRFRGTGETNAGTWQPTTTAKRYDGSEWKPLTIAKRFDGTNWIPLS